MIISEYIKTFLPYPFWDSYIKYQEKFQKNLHDSAMDDCSYCVEQVVFGVECIVPAYAE